MLDDEPLMDDVPERSCRRQSKLGLGPRLNANLAQLLGALPAGWQPSRRRSGGPRRAARRNRPADDHRARRAAPEAALQDQAEEPAVGVLQRDPADGQRAPALRGTARVSVSGRRRRDEHPVRRGDDRRDRQRASGAATALPIDSSAADRPGRERPGRRSPSFSLPSQGPGIVLLPMQVYRTRRQVERLAFDIAALRPRRRSSPATDSAICPEALRRYTDLVLRLPGSSPTIFETLFRGSWARPLPVNWQQVGPTG